MGATSVPPAALVETLRRKSTDKQRAMDPDSESILKKTRPLSYLKASLGLQPGCPSNRAGWPVL